MLVNINFQILFIWLKSLLIDWYQDPEQAVQIHQDVKSRKSVAVHWGAFALANEVF